MNINIVANINASSHEGRPLLFMLRIVSNMSYESNVCNGPLFTAMYNVQPYYDNSMPLELPQCMYTLNSVYSNEVMSKAPAHTNVTNMVRIPVIY